MPTFTPADAYTLPEFNYTPPGMVEHCTAWTHRVTPHPDGGERGPDLPVKLEPGTDRTIMRVPVFDVHFGHVLKIRARWRVTSELTYAVGIGTHLWQFNHALGSSISDWVQIPPWAGENVIKSPVHHQPLHLSATYVVPEDWPPGDPMAIVVRGNAHSTAAVAGHTVRTDGDNYSHLEVVHMVPGGAV